MPAASRALVDEPSSLLTRRWREVDSNHRFLVGRSNRDGRRAWLSCKGSGSVGAPKVRITALVLVAPGRFVRGVPAMLAFRRLLEDQDLGPEIVGGDGGGKPGRPNPATTTSVSTSH